MKHQFGLTLFVAFAASFAAVPAWAYNTYTWVGGSNTDWSNSANWSSGSVASVSGSSTAVMYDERIQIGVSGASTVNPCYYTAAQGYTVLGTTTNRGIIIGNNGNGDFVMTGGTLDSRSTMGDVVGNGTGIGTFTLNGGAYLNLYTGSVSGGILQITYGAGAVAGTGTFTVNAGLASIGAVHFSEGGSGSSTSIGVGVLNLNGGTLSTGAFVDAGSMTTSTINLNGGLLQARQSNASFISNVDNVYVQGGGAVIDTNGYSIGIANSLLAGTGSGGLTKIGSGTLILSGINAYTGVTTISAGVLQIGAGSNTGSIATNVVNNGALAFNRSDAYAFSNVISGTGSVSQIGAGTLTLTGANTYSGATTIAAGSTLQIGNGGSAGAIGSGAVTNNGTLAFNLSNAYTVAGAIGGSGNLVQNAASLLTLSGANSFAGTATVNAGTVALSSTGTLANATIFLGGSSTAAVVFDLSSKTAGYTINAISGVGTVQTPSASLVLTNAINHTGTDNLFINGNLRMAAGVTNTYEINLATDAYDYTSVNGTLNYNSTLLSIAFSGQKLTPGAYTYDIIDFGSMGSIALSSVTFTGLTDGESATYDATTGIVTLTVVPEPGALALLAGALFGLIAYAWRRKKN